MVINLDLMLVTSKTGKHRGTGYPIWFYNANSESAQSERGAITKSAAVLLNLTVNRMNKKCRAILIVARWVHIICVGVLRWINVLVRLHHMLAEFTHSTVMFTDEEYVDNPKTHRTLSHNHTVALQETAQPLGASPEFHVWKDTWGKEASWHLI